jgi:hypothetical protein
MLDQVVEQPAHIADEVVGGEGDVLGEGPEAGGQHGVKELVLVAVVGVDGLLVGVGGGGDAVDPGSGDAVGGELVGGGLEESCLRWSPC